MPDPILTLEPLIERVREGVLGTGWSLSGMQKTTSHQFEGRWEGDATRSAYLFFHRDRGPDTVSIDVFLDETTRGLSGNLALVAELRLLGAVGDVEGALASLGAIADAALPDQLRHPLTLRARLRDASDDPAGAELAVRFKVAIPRIVIAAGADAVRDVAEHATASFDAILRDPRLEGYLIAEE